MTRRNLSLRLKAVAKPPEEKDRQIKASRVPVQEKQLETVLSQKNVHLPPELLKRDV